ncbi:MAG: GAF domain-containing sensor histidine kinase [Ignavibacteriaceae bacterium]|nr:GAF domain-containing sensor histidine kinase [Ignavibacteriaceae bacterium]
MKFAEFKKMVDNKDGSVFVKDQSVSKIKNLEAILDIVNKINQTLILEDVLLLVLKNALELTNSERGFIVLIDPSGDLEYKVGLDSEGNQLPKESFSISTSVVKDVYTTGQSKFIEGVHSDADFDPSRSILRLELQTILCSPLITENKKIGVVYVDSKHLHKVKVSEITNTFEILAGQAATAIRNAQLYANQISAYNALDEANKQLIQAERKALKASIDSEIGQALQGLVHLALLETESSMRVIEAAQKNLGTKNKISSASDFDRISLKLKVAADSISKIQKYAQALLETSIMNLNKDSGDLNKTIQSVIRYISPIKTFSKIVFKTEFNNLPIVHYDSEQIQQLLVHIFTNSAQAKPNATINIKTYSENEKVVVVCSDDGPGIPHYISDLVFNPPSAEKPGYGLFLCKNIIDRHSGEINLSKTEIGTRIVFSLPIV